MYAPSAALSAWRLKTRMRCGSALPASAIERTRHRPVISSAGGGLKDDRGIQSLRFRRYGKTIRLRRHRHEFCDTISGSGHEII
jgi:hypothetical protein